MPQIINMNEVVRDMRARGELPLTDEDGEDMTGLRTRCRWLAAQHWKHE